MALPTVIREVRNFSVSVVSVGIRVPGGQAPFKMGSASARRICCQIGPSPSNDGITGYGPFPFSEDLGARKDFKTDRVANVFLTLDAISCAPWRMARARFDENSELVRRALFV